MALPLSNSFEGGTSATAITAANSGGASGNAFDSLVITAGAPVFDSAQFAHGSLGAKIAITASTESSMVWSTSAGAQSRIFGRFYHFSTAAHTTANWYFFRFLSGATSCCRFGLTPAGKWVLQNGANAAVFTSTASVTLSAWWRVEFDITFSATAGAGTMKIFAGDSTTATETQTFSAQNFGAATADTFKFGQASANTVTGTYWFDDLNLNATGLPGPAGGGAAVLLPYPVMLRQAVNRAAVI